MFKNQPRKTLNVKVFKYIYNFNILLIYEMNGYGITKLYIKKIKKY